MIAAEGEEKASTALKSASDTITRNPSAMQLRYLQTLNTISAEKNSTIIFPVPIEFLKPNPEKSKPCAYKQVGQVEWRVKEKF